MGFLDRLFNRNKQGQEQKKTSRELEETSAKSATASKPVETNPVEVVPDWSDPDITEDEKALVAAIATAGLANSLPSKKYRVKSVHKVDEDWIVAGLAAISGVSQGKENERFHIKSIKRVK